jgi:hypothetical protein
MASNAGFAAAKAASDPDAMIDNSPEAALAAPPDIGASRYINPKASARVAISRANSGETVAQDMARTIVEVFERYRDLFFKPFGEGSMRWALQPGVA